MTQYLYANDLKKVFAVYGSFYDVRLPDGETAACRNSLEIYRHGHPATVEPSRNYAHRPAAVAVMMNPGSSKPADRDYRPPCYEWAERNGVWSKTPVVPTIPDNAQYQIMRVMAHCGWDHVRVLNLSDLRNPKSSSFMAWVKELLPHCGYFHSLFDAARRAELAQALPEGTPLLLGWGQDAKLLPLAEKALAAFGERTVFGIAAKRAGLYQYPSPTLQSGKDAWLAAITNQLAGQWPN